MNDRLLRSLFPFFLSHPSPLRYKNSHHRVGEKSGGRDRRSARQRRGATVEAMGEDDEKQSEKRYISSEELRSHNTPSDLWISIQGKVYDATHWVKDHPGGELPLFNLAGQDVTDAFVAYHPGTAWSLLDRLPLVGYLSDYRVSDVSKDYRRLAADISKKGLFDKKGHITFIVLCHMCLMFAVVVYGVVCSPSEWVHLGCAVVLGFLWMQSGFLGHDSGHYRILNGPLVNRIMQVVSGNCLAGISIEWWKRNHNAHHIACNSLDFDPDVQHIPFFAVSSELFRGLTSYFYERKMSFDGVARLLVSYQHWTFYPVMCVARLNLFAQSVLLLLSNKRVRGRGQELVGLGVFWVWFPLLVSYLPSWGERVMFVVVSFAVAGIQHVQFCLNHFSSSVYVGPPRGNDWFEKQTMGTLDITCEPWMDWFHGGLQFQVEHHLFPRLPRSQLRRISPLVRELCKKHGLPYDSSSFWEANVRTIRTLRTAALQARDSANPVPKNLVWEAVNTHG
ncbi:Desaturase [Musa troglodytarum]|uniref:Desaturase n=1 Tax=Musa troglodytarum TaxID=320322 RepID=A0A9E7EAH4_9LILI|nr:Desaturase [Musa troglodytarum]